MGMLAVMSVCLSVCQSGCCSVCLFTGGSPRDRSHGAPLPLPCPAPEWTSSPLISSGPPCPPFPIRWTCLNSSTWGIPVGKQVAGFPVKGFLVCTYSHLKIKLKCVKFTLHLNLFLQMFSVELLNLHGLKLK